MTDISGATVATPVLPIVRVAILADGRITEVALPAQVPLREIMPAVFKLLPEHDDEQEDSGFRVGSAWPRSVGRRSLSTPPSTPSVSSTVICLRCSRFPPVPPHRGSSRTSPTPR